jgi:hypothetical protein
VRVRLLAGAAALIVSAASCGLAVEEEVNVLLPAPPVPWQIAFPGMSFSVVTRTAHSIEQTAATDWRALVAVRCVRSVNVPVLAWPSQEHLRPAGGFYPLSLRDFQGQEVLELTWRDGAAALVMERLARQGRDLSLFNLPRLRLFLGESEDPWDIDLDTVAQEISRGDFSAWEIDRLPCRSVDLRPGDGTWFLESPFSGSYRADEGRIRLASVSLGAHHLFALDGSRWRLEVGPRETLLTAAR